MPNYFSLQELISASQAADMKKAEQEYFQEKAQHAEASARALKPTEVTYNKLLQLLYGDDIPAPAPMAVPKVPEKKDDRPVEAFPAPPTSHS